jgi:pimeloyl-ACP methyl ester carboxylesterase
MSTRHVGRWRSETGRRAYAESYAAALALLPAPTGVVEVPTAFGTVRTYAFGSPRSAAAAPLVLLPGRSSGVPMWASNVRDLAEDRAVHAVDTLGDAGLSVQTRPFTGADDQAAWLDEVIGTLDVPAVHLAGHSFGGWSAASYATRHPERVLTLTLVEPVFVLAGLRAKIYLRSIPAALPFLPRSWRARMLAGIGGVDELDLDDPLGRMISDATEYFAAALPAPRRLTPEQLHALRMPVYVALADRSSLHDAAAAAEVARSALPDVRVRLWPDATHSLPLEYPGPLDREIRAFLAAHDPA